jgi:8-oxo-dGTP pyrophosphatase MutT (NUDIX family)
MYAPGRLRESLRAALDPVDRTFEVPDGRRPAAVLLPLVDGPEPTVVFTRRTEDLPRHPGEISFPGGMWHDDDSDLLGTALRETEEELGLARELVEILGSLEPLQTYTTGFTIAAFVGALDVDPAFTANPGEIAEVLEFPVSRLLDTEEPKTWTRDDDVYHGFVYELEGHTIWGATARILHDFLERMREERT